MSVEVVKRVLELNLINDEQPSVELFDLDYLESRVKSLQAAFPEPFFQHAMAVKANPVRGIMKVVRDLGLGAECASMQEAKHAVALGFEGKKVVYDSPVKTPLELREAIDLGLHMNLDNEYEIAIVDKYVKEKCGQDFTGLKAVIGLRINPVVGGGQIAMMSTATKQSKFGLPLTEETKERVVDVFRVNPWLKAIHIHIGSQGVALDKFVSGCRSLMDFVAVIENACPGQITTLDIGGGLSTSYTAAGEPEQFSYKNYRELLAKEVPELLTGRYQIVTEMGRSLFCKAGTSLTRIESIKDWIPEQNPILLTHLGTNQFPREVYLPQVWRHRFSCFTSTGEEKTDDKIMVDIGGPLCFQGDYLAKEVELGRPVPGDILAVHDTGAYTMSMYCRFNSIRASPIYGYRRRPDGSLAIIVIKPRETLQECLAFWGPEQTTEVVDSM